MSLADELFTQTCYVYPVASTDKFGKTTLSTTPVTHRCKWAKKTMEVQSPSGSKFNSTSQVYIETDVPIGSVVLQEPLATVNPNSIDGRCNTVNSVTRTSDPDEEETFYVLYL